MANRPPNQLDQKPKRKNEINGFNQFQTICNNATIRLKTLKQSPTNILEPL